MIGVPLQESQNKPVNLETINKNQNIQEDLSIYGTIPNN